MTGERGGQGEPGQTAGRAGASGSIVALDSGKTCIQPPPSPHYGEIKNRPGATFDGEPTLRRRGPADPEAVPGGEPRRPLRVGTARPLRPPARRVGLRGARGATR